MTRLSLAIVLLLVWLAPPLAVMGQETEAALRGEFAVTIATEDVPPDLIDGASLIGRWQITFADDGGYTLGRQDVGPLVTGQFESNGEQLTLRAETGVLACGSGEDDATATYTWQITGERLQLVAIEEPCAKRRLLLTTRALSVFAACPPPGPVDTAAAAGTPTRETIRSASDEVGSATPATRAALESAIDNVLRQMSDCWATREPERFLALLSEDFQAMQRPDDDDDARRFTLAMAAPIVWDRVSDVDQVDATHATANVRQTVGDNIDVVRYEFVYEGGAWRWDGTADAP
jgi:hypothetical protein